MHSYGASLFPCPFNVPRSHKEAMAQSDAYKWKEAEEKEVNQLNKLKVVEMVPLPPGAHVLPSRWVFTKKKSGLYKVQFVARGDKQRAEVDYEDTFA